MYPRPRLILCLGDPLAAGPFLPGARSWAAGIPGSRSRNLRCRPAGRPSPEPAAGAAPPIPITTVRSSRSADPSTAAFCNVTSRCKKAPTSSDFGSTGTADTYGSGILGICQLRGAEQTFCAHPLRHSRHRQGARNRRSARHRARSRITLCNSRWSASGAQVTDAPMSVKAFFSADWRIVDLLGCGHDRDGPLPVGGQALIRSRAQQGTGIRSGRQIGSRPARGAAAVMRARPLRKWPQVRPAAARPRRRVR